ncbi:MAG: PEP/pyruvate-binding domain-containing protein [Actinomycetota bacterium]
MISHTTQPTIDLHSAGREPVEEIGHKAHSLAVLAEEGFPIPNGVILPSSWLEMVSDDALRSELDVILNRLDTPLAVRSSALAEDTGTQSFAGLYETVLSVDGPEDLLDAVRRVKASAGSARVRTYGGGSPDIAVLIQEMVSAVAAGVAFTADPVTGERDVIIVSSVSGLGDRLVSGEADPDEWEVRAGMAAARRTPENSLTDRQVLEVADLAQRAEHHFGHPQDIEWAFDGESLLLLQSRPITGLPDVEPIEPDLSAPDDDFWMLDGGHYPSPMSPMGASFYLPALETGASEAFRDWGLLLDGIESETVGWRVYTKPVPLGGKSGPAPPWWLMGILARVVPPIRRQARKAREAFESGRVDEVIRRWWEEWRPEFREEIARLQSVDLGRLDDAGLLRHLDEVLGFVARGQRVHFELFPPYMVATAELVRFCETELGWTKAKATGLLSGLSTMSSEPARRLRELAHAARSRPATRAVLEGDEATLDRLRDADEDFARLLDKYLDDFGIRATAYDVLAPTVGEQEDLILSSIESESRYDPDEVERAQTAAREQALEEARTTLLDDPTRLQEFEMLVSRVEEAYPVREDNIVFTDNAPVGLVRLTALEIGRRLCERGLIDEPEHVLFLTIDEARKSLRAGPARQGIVRTRRGEREWALRNPPVPSFGEDPGPPPDMRAMPDGVRRLMDALGLFRNKT